MNELNIIIVKNNWRRERKRREKKITAGFDVLLASLPKTPEKSTVVNHY